MRIFKFIIAILCVFLSIGYGIALFNLIPMLNIGNPTLRYFIYGFVAFIPFWAIWLRKAYFFSTFEHELTHLLVGLLFFKKPAGFKVTDSEGGVTELYGGNFLITLAPYFLPTFTYILLLFYFIIDPRFYLYYFFILGLITSYHIFSTIQEFSYSQPDIIVSGRVFSTLFLIFANIFVYGYLVAFLIGGFREGGVYIRNGWHLSIKWILSSVQNLTGR